MLQENKSVPKLENEARVALVVAQFNHDIISGLERGSRKALYDAGIPEDHIERFAVPGSIEIPLIAKRAAQTGRFDAIICLGAIIKGETKHDYFVGKVVSDGMREVMMHFEIPVLFGVLTCENKEQAIARSSDDVHNRGYEAAVAAIEMINLLHTFPNL